MAPAPKTTPTRRRSPAPNLEAAGINAPPPAPEPAAPVVRGRGSDGMYRHRMPDGSTLTVPSISTLDPTMEQAEAFTDGVTDPNPLVRMAAQSRFLRACLPADASSALGKLKSSEFLAFVQGWGQHSGVKLGE